MSVLSVVFFYLQYLLHLSLKEKHNAYWTQTPSSGSLTNYKVNGPIEVTWSSPPIPGKARKVLNVRDDIKKTKLNTQIKSDYFKIANQGEVIRFLLFSVGRCSLIISYKLLMSTLSTRREITKTTI
jgi:hypothetical protein